MAVFEAGGLARSLAGHDKNKLYIIISVSGEYVTLADGALRPVDRPKRKNIKHLQPILWYDQEIKRKLADGKPVRDEEIKYFIRCYTRLQGGK